MLHDTRVEEEAQAALTSDRKKRSLSRYGRVAGSHTLLCQNAPSIAQTAAKNAARTYCQNVHQAHIPLCQANIRVLKPEMLNADNNG